MKRTSRAIELLHLAKQYRSGPETIHVLRDVTCSMDRGESIVIRGESGSGKTTLLNLIGGLDRPDGGTVLVDGMDLSGMDDAETTAYRSRHVGFIFQFHYLLGDFSALENVMLPAYIGGESRRTSHEKACELLRQVNLSDRIHHYPHQLSGGERQRVAVARALVNDPLLLLADEPTGNLDEGNSSVIEELIFRLASEHEKTLVVVTHDRNMAARGTRSLLLEGGQLHE